MARLGFQTRTLPVAVQRAISTQCLPDLHNIFYIDMSDELKGRLLQYNLGNCYI